MTREQIIALTREVAREAGTAGMLANFVATLDELETFAALVAAHEREECAKVVERGIKTVPRLGIITAQYIAADIRSRT